MADLAEEVAEAIRKAFNVGHRAIPSAAPGGGPSSQREGPGPHEAGGHMPHTPPRGGRQLGYGGHGDPVVLDTRAEAEVREEIQDSIEAAARTRQREPRPRGKVRLNIPFSPEAHIREDWDSAVGPFSLFDGTSTAPSAGNSTQLIPVQLPQGAPSPVQLLDRYPGALYMCLHVRSVAWVPLGAAMTGWQELYFQDAGGAVVALGVYSAASGTNMQTIKALCNTPLTDPGNTVLGNLVVVNQTIAGTPVGARWQLGVGYVAMIPDPWFNEQVSIPPTPAEVTQALRSMEA